MDAEISAVIASVRYLVMSGASVEDLATEISKLLAIAPMSIGLAIEPGTALYRVTKHHSSVPQRIEDIWFPPQHLVKTFGRANRPGCPMFYACSDPHGAMIETATSLGDFVIRAKWVAKRRLIMHDLGFSSQVLQRAGAHRPLPDRHVEFDHFLDDRAKRMRDFIALSFTDPTDQHYVLTTAIAEVHLRGDFFDGILYPTVAKRCDTDNVALRPETVVNALELDSAEAITIDEITPDGSINGDGFGRLASVNNGTLTWRYPTNKPDIQIQPQSTQLLHIAEGDKLRVPITVELSIDGFKYQLTPGATIQVLGGAIVARNSRGETIQPIP